MSKELSDSSLYEIYFSIESTVCVTTKNPYILISPDQGRWDDFGHKCDCTYVIREGQEEIYKERVKIGFLGEVQSAFTVIKQFVSEGYSNAVDLPQFFSLYGTLPEFRRIVTDLGVDKAKTTLLSLNDLVALRFYKKIPSWLTEAINSEVFALSFVRNSEDFFAFHNADSVLGGVEEEAFDRISNKMFLKFQLSGFDNEHKLEFSFDSNSLLPKRINVIIGKNGLGKSQALSRIVKSLLASNNEFTGSDNARPMISRLLALGTPGETTNTFPNESKKANINYRRLMLRRNSRIKHSRGFGELITQLVRLDERIGGSDRWRLFLDSVKNCLALEDIMVPLDDYTRNAAVSHVKYEPSGRYVPLTKLDSGGEQAKLEIWAAIRPKSDPVRIIEGKSFPLSSGQLAFLQFAIQACLFIENGTLVLLDEPETHLHPNLITGFVELLDNLLEKSGSVAILATHSAYFVREVTSKQVLVFKESKSGYIEVTHPYLKTFGANVGALSHFVFEDELTNRLMRKIESKIQENKNIKDKIIDDITEDLSIKALMLLKNKSFG